VLSIGGYAGYSSFRYRDDNNGYNYAAVLIGPRTAYYLDLDDSFAVYGGIMLGYRGFNKDRVGDDDDLETINLSPLFYSLHIGANYYFYENIAGMVELGYGITFFSVGICAVL
jgi:hypothetical protein